MITVLIADDQPLIRSAVRALLDREPDIDVVGEAATGTEAVAAARALRPTVVVMDIRMPEGDGIWATRQLLAQSALAETKVLILTTFEEDAFIFDALKAGASGFLGKGTDGAGLTAAVRSVASGEALLSPVATRRIIETYLQRGPDPAADRETAAARLAGLTEREAEVLQLVGWGLTNQAIAERLFISPLTVKTHVNRLMSKLHAHDRSQLVIEAYESGLVRPGEGPERTAGEA